MSNHNSIIIRTISIITLLAFMLTQCVPAYALRQVELSERPAGAVGEVKAALTPLRQGSGGQAGSEPSAAKMSGEAGVGGQNRRGFLKALGLGLAVSQLPISCAEKPERAVITDPEPEKEARIWINQTLKQNGVKSSILPLKEFAEFLRSQNYGFVCIGLAVPVWWGANDRMNPEIAVYKEVDEKTIQTYAHEAVHAMHYVKGASHPIDAMAGVDIRTGLIRTDRDAVAYERFMDTAYFSLLSAVKGNNKLRLLLEIAHHKFIESYNPVESFVVKEENIPKPSGFTSGSWSKVKNQKTNKEVSLPPGYSIDNEGRYRRLAHESSAQTETFAWIYGILMARQFDKSSLEERRKAREDARDKMLKEGLKSNPNKDASVESEMEEICDFITSGNAPDAFIEALRTHYAQLNLPLPQVLVSSPSAAPASGAPTTADMSGHEPQGFTAGEAGLCVTGDTMLPILQNDIELKPIVEVKPGDYVLSLNEDTQAIEPHRVNALLDMEVKPVYRLTTASGRSIKTTANHPYLTKGKRKKEKEKSQNSTNSTNSTNSIWMKVSGLKAGDEIACPVGLKVFYEVVPGKINGRAWPVYGGQHTSELTQRQEKQTLLKEQAFLLFSFFSGLNKDAYNQHYRPSYREDNSQKQWEFFKEITCQPNSKYGFPQVSYYFGNKFSSNIVYSLHRLELYYIIKSLSSLLFLPSAFAEPVLDSGILWDKIASIEPFGYEHVYDIEVDGTHNFIANGIFAHNTYLKEGNEPGAAPAGGVTKANVNVDREPVYFHGSSATIFEFFDKTGFKILPIGKLFELQIPLFSGEMGNGASERGVNQRRVSTSASYEKAMRSYADVNYMGHLIKNSLQEYETELAKYEEELRMRKLGVGSTMYNLYKGFMANLENIIAYLKEEEAQGHSSAEAMSRFRARSFPIVFGIKKNVASRAKPVASVNIFGWLEEYAITGYVGLWEVSHIYTEKDIIDIVKEELNKLVEKMRTSGMYNEAEEVEKIKVVSFEEGSRAAPAAGASANAAAEGLCVAGDTLLPILSAKEILPHQRDPVIGTNPNNQNIELKPIVAVKSGDYVLSLNEETQQIEPHRINGLLDMGVKPVYRLTTVSGRSIKTTANHPYLVKTERVAYSVERIADRKDSV